MAYQPATFELGRNLRLNHHTSPERALEALTECIRDLENLVLDARTPDALIRTRDEYLIWVEAAERRLSELTYDENVVARLHTPRYWEIRRLIPSDARPIPLIEGEKRSQLDTLRALRDNLEVHVDRAKSAPGHITVLDTNTLLHYQLPDSIDWPAVVGHNGVRLVVPLRVVEELDAKKYSESPKMRSRARELLPKLDELIGLMGSPTPLKSPTTTIEVPIEYVSGQPRLSPSTPMKRFSSLAASLPSFPDRSPSRSSLTTRLCEFGPRRSATFARSGFRTSTRGRLARVATRKTDRLAVQVHRWAE